MLFEYAEELSLDGTKFLDITSRLSELVNTETLGIRLSFSSVSVKSQTMFSLCFKDRFLPDFSVGLSEGLLQVMTRHKGQTIIGYSEKACCDGEEHELLLSAEKDGIRAFVDQEQVLFLSGIFPYCEFSYVGIAALGRGCRDHEFGGFFMGSLKHIQISRHVQVPQDGTGKEDDPLLFYKGLKGYINYRIPSLIVTRNHTLIAAADGRKEAGGDNPNHITRVIRRSTDSGRTWSEPEVICDYGGTGREEGAAAVDGSMVCDEETGTVFLLFGHTPAGIGSVNCTPGTGMDQEGNLLLKKNGELEEQEWKTPEEHGVSVDRLRRVYRKQELISSSAHGKNREFTERNTAFLQLMYSQDDGLTWSGPVDLNASVKKDWMCFLGPGPGTGICLTSGERRGRLIFPVYYSNAAGLYSCGVIYSDDHGQSWTMGESVNDGRYWKGSCLSAKNSTDQEAFLGEAQVTELDHGRIRIFIRNAVYGAIATAVSEDGGESWIQEEGGLDVIWELTDCNCQCHVLRLRQGARPRWLFSNPSDQRYRAQGRIRVSSNGESGWSEGLLVRSGGFAYSCMAELPDGAVGILYEDGNVDIRFRRIPAGALLYS